MIYRPRAGSRPDGTHRSRINNHRSPPDARGRRSFVFGVKPDSGQLRTERGGRGPERGRQEENGGRPPPFPGHPAPGSIHPSSEPSRADGRRSVWGCVYRESAASARRVLGGRQARKAPGYTPQRSPGDVETPGTGEPLGGPAIARSGRVVRPVRRPSDRENPRRTSGDPREICNQVPSDEPGAFSFGAGSDA
jgi:hypothetical protein